MHDVKQLVKCGLYTGLNLFLYFPFFGQVNSFLSVIWEGGPQKFAGGPHGDSMMLMLNKKSTLVSFKSAKKEINYLHRLKVAKKNNTPI